MKPPYILFIIASLSVLVLKATAQSWLTNGLVAYYPLDGNANDASGHGINGVMYNVSPTNNRFSQPASALMFRGTNGSYVDMGAPASLRFTGDFTITTWVKFNPDHLDDRIWSYGGNSGYELLAGENSSTRHFGVNLGDIKFGVDISSSGGQWNFVAVRRTGSTTTIFVDGVFAWTNTVTSVPGFSGNLLLGMKAAPYSTAISMAPLTICVFTTAPCRRTN